MAPPLSNPKAAAELGEKIYQDLYKEQYEQEHQGKFVAIDVTSEKAYLDDAPEKVLESARKASPVGIFHLIKVGFPGAFRVSYSNHVELDRLFQ